MTTPATESRIGSAAGGSPAIEVEKLRVRYRRTATDAITGLDLRVCQGQTVALIGTNGAGKSTLLKCLVRLTEPTGGTIRIGGKPVTGASRRAVRQHRRDVGFVFQGFHLIPRLTAFHNVLQGAMGRRGARCAWPWIAPGDVRDEAMACLERVRLGDFADRRVELLSGGQQQRVAIARMLMQRPDVILADEPVASLDPLSANDVLGLLCSIARERDVTVLMTLHQIDLALRYADRVVGMRNGTIEFDELTRHCDIERLTPIFARAAS